jgi:L-rhamnose mutarotase
MIRECYLMKLLPGQAREYKKRHDEIWPELERAMKEAGMVECVICLDEASDTLFCVETFRDHNATSSLAENSIVHKWWDYLADIMETQLDHSPKCWPLREMYYYENDEQAQT